MAVGVDNMVDLKSNVFENFGHFNSLCGSSSRNPTVAARSEFKERIL